MPFRKISPSEPAWRSRLCRVLVSSDAVFDDEYQTVPGVEVLQSGCSSSDDSLLSKESAAIAQKMQRPLPSPPPTHRPRGIEDSSVSNLPFDRTSGAEILHFLQAGSIIAYTRELVDKMGPANKDTAYGYLAREILTTDLAVINLFDGFTLNLWFSPMQ